MRMMSEYPPDATIAIWFDLEAIDSPLEFYRTVATECNHLLNRYQRLLLHVKTVVGAFSQLKIGPIQLPILQSTDWKALLRFLLDGAQKGSGERIVLFLDEIPLMLHKIIKLHGGITASSVLEVIRRIMNEQPDGLRIVYAGSLGMHHVLRLMAKETGLNIPNINTSQIFSIHPLEHDAAKTLAAIWIEKLTLACDVGVADTIAQESCGIPFYIECIVLQMSSSKTWSESMIQELTKQAISDPADTWHIRSDHFDRIDNLDYYSKQDRRISRNVLTIIAHNENEITERDLMNQVKQFDTHVSRSIDDVRLVLANLCRDHLLKKENIDSGGSAYKFRYDIVKTVWIFDNPRTPK